MEKKYINEDRYKKGMVRKRRSSSTVRSNLKSKTQVIVKEKQSLKKKVKSKNRIKKQPKENKLVNVLICIILLIGIAAISRAILKDENDPFISFPFMVSENEEVIKIGVITSDSLLDPDTDNLVLNELNKYSKNMLLEINEDYSITYGCISAVEKISNSEYLLTKNPDSKITVEEIKEALNSYSQNEQSVYYANLKNIDSITIVNENILNIKLKESDQYFIYDLEVCLPTLYDTTNYVQDDSSSEDKLILNRHKDADKELPAQVVITKYKDMYDAVEAYKDKEIDIFTTDAENVQNILGKYEYNIKTYRNGKCVFLFGNPESELYSLPEVRQAIAYSIDRDGIIKDILNSKGDKIDLPYVYDNIKYKYDVYAAENLLLTNKYLKNNKVYSKTENGKKTTLELNLIVNKNDDLKVSIANKINNNLAAVGIKVNVVELTEAKMVQRIQTGNYDLCLANVYLNNNPDISFVQSNLYTTEEIDTIIQNIKDSTIENLSANIAEIRSKLSQQICAIGIYSDISYMIYSKDIIGIEQISYMNLFKDILD